MTFRDAIKEDEFNVFLNTDEFAEEMTVYIGGVRREKVRGILIKSERKNRESFQYKDDYRKGIYRWDARLYLDEAQAGHFPKTEEPVVIIRASGEREDYRVRNSEVQDGMIRLDLNIYGD